jgi:hypothetical protein
MSGATEFLPLTEEEARVLLNALRSNAERGSAILTNPRDTGFAGMTDEITDNDDEVISAIKSVPCHY